MTGTSASQEWDGVSIKSGKGDDEPREKNSVSSLFEDPAVQVTRGPRPNLKQILQEEANFTDERMGVTGLCCPMVNGQIHAANRDVNAQCAVLNLLPLP